MSLDQYLVYGVERLTMLNELFLIVLFVILQIADVMTTEAIIRKGGRELNLVMRYFFNRFGIHNVLVFKALACVASGILLAEILPEGLIFLIVIYTGVVAWNLNEWRKMR